MAAPELYGFSIETPEPFPLTSTFPKLYGLSLELVQDDDPEPVPTFPKLYGLSIEDRTPIPEGDVWVEEFAMIGSNQAGVAPSVDVPDIKGDCCFRHEVYADAASDDPLLNDFRTFMRRFNSSVLSVSMWLQKDGEDLEELIDDTFGTHYAYGWVEKSGEKLVGYTIDFRSVLLVHGTGNYRIRFELEDINGDPSSLYSWQYCLIRYNGWLVKDTIRLEFTNNGVIGDPFDDTRRQDFSGLNLVDQIRLPYGKLLPLREDREKTRVRYTNNEINEVSAEQTEILRLVIGPLPYDVHKFIARQVVNADTILVTNYSPSSPIKDAVNKNIKVESGYPPNWEANAEKAGVILEVIPGFNNNDKISCP